MPYVLVPGCTDKVNLDSVKSNMSDEEERTLTKDMEKTYERLIPSRKVEENREKLVKKLQGMFNDEWPGHDIQVHLFGSSGNLLCSDDSDGALWRAPDLQCAKWLTRQQWIFVSRPTGKKWRASA